MATEIPVISMEMLKEIRVGGNLIHLERILVFEITQRVNDHARIRLSIRINDNERDLYLNLAKTTTLIKVVQWKFINEEDEGGKKKTEAMLFSGIMTNMDIMYP